MSADYHKIWNAIKQHGMAEVTVSHANVRPVLNGIKRVKTAENVARRLAGLVGWSKLTITQTKLSDKYVKITVSLLYRTDL